MTSVNNARVYSARTVRDNLLRSFKPQVLSLCTIHWPWPRGQKDGLGVDHIASALPWLALAFFTAGSVKDPATNVRINVQALSLRLM